MNKATRELLEQHFDTAFAAPDGVNKLRELILTLAMQGKLVSQDINEQPISDVLNELESQKLNLLEQRKVKYRDVTENPDIVAMKYDVPDNWAWMRFRDAVFFQEGPGIRNWQFQSEGIKLLNVSNILFNDCLDFSNSDKYVSEEEFLEKYQHFLIEEEDLLFAGSGASWGKVAWYKNPGFRVMLNTSTMRLRFFYEEFAKNYLLYFLKSEFFKTQMAIQLVGLQPNFGSTHLSRIYIPIPPIGEQHRIVAKIAQLMARCDELEKLRAEREQRRLSVHAAAINRLTSPTASFPRIPSRAQGRESMAAENLDSRRPWNDDEMGSLNEAWHFITQHFAELYAVKPNVAELRKAILQLAVMGKLVPQDPNAPPASELLKEIEAEKLRLVKEGKIKAPKPLPEIKPEEMPYALPPGWEWVRMGWVSEIVGGFAYKSTLFKTEGTNQVLRLGNIRPDLIRTEENPVYIDEKLAKESMDFRLVENDILITMTGTREKRDYLYTATVKTNPFNGKYLYLNQRVGAIRPFHFSGYLNKALKVESIKDAVFASATGSANQANVGITTLREWVVPLPPLPEQHRIVAKIDSLMALCDSLEQQIDAATGKQTELLNALMAQVPGV